MTTSGAQAQLAELIPVDTCWWQFYWVPDLLLQGFCWEKYQCGPVGSATVRRVQMSITGRLELK